MKNEVFAGRVRGRGALPRLEQDRPRKIVIVGAGLMGAAAADRLSALARAVRGSRAGDRARTRPGERPRRR